MMMAMRMRMGRNRKKAQPTFLRVRIPLLYKHRISSCTVIRPQSAEWSGVEGG